MQVLQFKLFPVTIVNWANWYLEMWDLYTKRTPHAFNECCDFTFKTPNEEAYQRFRTLLQFIDAISLDY